MGVKRILTQTRRCGEALCRSITTEARVICLLGLTAVLVLSLLFAPGRYITILAEAHEVQWLMIEVPPTQFLTRSSSLQRGEGLYYRPASYFLSHGLWRLAGREINPMPSMVFQIAVHLLVVGLVYTLLVVGSVLPARDNRRARALGALAGALFIGLHPSSLPAVLDIAVRHGSIIVALFLILAICYTLALRRPADRPPILAFVLLPFVAFLMPMFNEIGMLGGGVLGLWLLYECFRKRSFRFAAWCILPLLAVPVVYLTLRRIALGQMGAPYVEVDLSLFEKLGLFVYNFIVDVTILLNPIQLEILQVPTRSPLHILFSAFVIVVPIIGLLFWHPVRRWLAANPLPVIGLVLFFLFQTKVLWPIYRPEIHVEGFNRGFIYYFPVCLLALLLGDGLSRLFAISSMPVRLLIGTIITLHLLAMAGRARETILLYLQGTDFLHTHKQQLMPVLEEIDQGSQLYMRGFPPFIKEPNLPWIPVWSLSNSMILEYWTGKPFQVYYEERHGSPPSRFDGWILELDQGGNLDVRRESPRNSVRHYIESISGRPLPQPIELLEREPYWWDAEPRESPGTGILRLVATGVDPSIGYPLDIDPLHYGQLTIELRALETESPAETQDLSVYFQGSMDPGLDEFLKASMTFPIDGDWHTLHIPLFANSRWTQRERINYLRVDPIEGRGMVDIRSIRLGNDLEAARRYLEQ